MPSREDSILASWTARSTAERPARRREGERRPAPVGLPLLPRSCARSCEVNCSFNARLRENTRRCLCSVLLLGLVSAEDFISRSCFGIQKLDARTHLSKVSERRDWVPSMRKDARGGRESETASPFPSSHRCAPFSGASDDGPQRSRQRRRDEQLRHRLLAFLCFSRERARRGHFNLAGHFMGNRGVLTLHVLARCTGYVRS